MWADAQPGAIKNIQESDGSPDVFPWQIRVSNGTLTDNADGTVTLTTGGGGGNSFETIAVPAGTNPVADSSTDTLTITETTFLTITGTAGTDTIDVTQVTTDLGTDGLIALNAVALGTDTTNAYVADLAATANETTVSGGGGETATVTIGLPDDVTLTTSLTVVSTDPADAGQIRLNNAAIIGWEASPAGTDVTLATDSSEEVLLDGAVGLGLDDQADLRFYETDANGTNFLAFEAPAAITTTSTCTLENDGNPIPDSCVGDGVDGGGGGNSFETWAVPDANNIVADSATDTATFTETAGFDITGTVATDTINFAVDLTEVSTLTLGSGAFTTLTFDAGATDPIFTAATTSLAFSGSGGTTANLLIDDQGAVRFLEEDAGGSNFKGFVAPATITADTTCTFEDDANFIPDSCVGDGTDAGGTDTNADKEFWWPAPAMLPLEAAESIPPIAKDAGTNLDLMTVDFDQSTDECRTVDFIAPADITSGGTVTFTIMWYAASVTTNEVIFDFRHNSGVADGVDPDAALTTEASAASTAPGTAGQIDILTWTETQTNLAWAASDLVVGVVCRDANNVDDDFAADAKVIGFGIRIPRS